MCLTSQVIAASGVPVGSSEGYRRHKPGTVPCKITNKYAAGAQKNANILLAKIPCAGSSEGSRCRELVGADQARGNNQLREKYIMSVTCVEVINTYIYVCITCI